MPLIHCLLSSSPPLLSRPLQHWQCPNIQPLYSIQSSNIQPDSIWNQNTSTKRPSHRTIGTQFGGTVTTNHAFLTNTDNDGLRPLSCITGQREGRVVCRDRTECQGSHALQLLQLRNNVKCARTPYLIHWHPQFTVAASKQCRILCRQSCSPSLLCGINIHWTATQLMLEAYIWCRWTKMCLWVPFFGRERLLWDK